MVADGGHRAGVLGGVVLGAALLSGGSVLGTLAVGAGVMTVAWAAAALHPNSAAQPINKPILCAVIAIGLFILSDGSFLGMLELGSILAALAMAISWFA